MALAVVECGCCTLVQTVRSLDPLTRRGKEGMGRGKEGMGRGKEGMGRGKEGMTIHICLQEVISRSLQ